MEEKTAEIEVAVAEVVDYLRVIGQFRPALHVVVERKLASQEAMKRGLSVSNEELQKASDAFRLIHGLNKAKDTEEWIRSSGVTLETLEDYLETNILMSKFKEELEKQTDNSRYLSSPEIQESVREMIYNDWLKSQLG